MSFAGNALPRHTNSSGILHNLDWLPIEQRIKFKLAMLTYNIPVSYTHLTLPTNREV